MHKRLTRLSVHLVIVVLSVFLILSAIPFPSQLASGEEIDWNTYEEGTDKAQRDNNPILIDFMTDWCGACEKMENDTYTDPRVQERTDDIVFIEVNAEERGNLASEYEISSVPTLVFESPDREEIDREVGFLSASELVEELDALSDEFGGGQDEKSSNEDLDQDVDEETPFWKDMIFLNVVISTIVAVAIILVLKRRGEDEET